VTSAASKPALPPETHIGHTHLKVADIDRAVHFYCDILGFDLIQRIGDQAAFVSAGGYHHHIGLNTWTSRGGTPPPPGHTGLYHHAIVLPDRKSLAEVVKRIVDSGWPLRGASDHLTHEAIYLDDPDGNGIELYWDRPREQWPRGADGRINLVGGHPLDVEDLLAEVQRVTA
jgi:catechol 2,3-dioxygenase